MSNIYNILKNVGVGTRSIKTDEVSLKKYIQKYELLYAAFESTPITGTEVCNNGNVSVNRNTIVHHTPANKEILLGS